MKKRHIKSQKGRYANFVEMKAPNEEQVTEELVIDSITLTPINLEYLKFDNCFVLNTFGEFLIPL